MIEAGWNRRAQATQGRINPAESRIREAKNRVRSSESQRWMMRTATPPQTPEAQARARARNAGDRPRFELADSPEERTLTERCLWFPVQGPPMLPRGARFAEQP